MHTLLSNDHPRHPKVFLTRLWNNDQYTQICPLNNFESCLLDSSYGVASTNEAISKQERKRGKQSKKLTFTQHHPAIHNGNIELQDSPSCPPCYSYLKPHLRKGRTLGRLECGYDVTNRNPHVFIRGLPGGNSGKRLAVNHHHHQSKDCLGWDYQNRMVQSEKEMTHTAAALDMLKAVFGMGHIKSSHGLDRTMPKYSHTDGGHKVVKDTASVVECMVGIGTAGCTEVNSISQEDVGNSGGKVEDSPDSSLDGHGLVMNQLVSWPMDVCQEQVDIVPCACVLTLRWDKK